MLQLHRIDDGKEYAEFMHLPKKRFTDFGILSVRVELLLVLINFLAFTFSASYANPSTINSF